MKFDLGPAEKIFGPGGVQIKTQGSAELKLGANTTSVDNPTLPLRYRNTFGFDFDEKINVSVNGKVGDKMDMTLNYNTEATFDVDSKDLKLTYEGKEDEVTSQCLQTCRLYAGRRHCLARGWICSLVN